MIMISFFLYAKETSQVDISSAPKHLLLLTVIKIDHEYCPASQE